MHYCNLAYFYNCNISIMQILQFAIQQRLWGSLRTYPQNMTKPAKPVLTEGKLYSSKISTSQHFVVGDPL